MGTLLSSALAGSPVQTAGATAAPARQVRVPRRHRRRRGIAKRSTTRTASLTDLSGRARTRSRGTGAARSVVTVVLAGPTCTTVLLELRGSAGSRLAWVVPAAGTTTRT